MIQATGDIAMKVIYNPLNHIKERIDFKWSGGAVIYLSMWLSDDLDPAMIHPDPFSNPAEGFIFSVGPFRLKILEVDYLSHRLTCVRIDSLSGHLRYYWHRLNKIIDLIYRRLIITAVVWNCAKREPGVIPTWRDLYLAQKIIKAIRR